MPVPLAPRTANYRATPRPTGVAVFMSAHSKTPYITPSMDFYSGKGVVRGRRGQQLGFALATADPAAAPCATADGNPAAAPTTDGNRLSLQSIGSAVCVHHVCPATQTTNHTPHVTRHTSHVTCHTPQATHAAGSLFASRTHLRSEYDAGVVW